MPVDPVRDAAIDVLLRVFTRDMHLDQSLDKTLRRKSMSDRGRRFMTQLVYGTVRHSLLCDYVLRPICRQPLEQFPVPILLILRMAVFQAFFCNQVTQPAMVHTSVDLAKKRGHAGLARLVNAVLRRVPASLEETRLPSREANFTDFLSIRYSTPRWLVESWQSEFGNDRAESLCAASEVQAPVTLRVNTLKTSVEDLADHLKRSGIETQKSTPIPEELTLIGAGLPVHTQWFREGHFIFQDPASLLPAHVLEPKPGDWVLDLCAAPGGKSTHAAQLCQGQAQILALDRDWSRLNTVKENVERLGVGNIHVIASDSTCPPLPVSRFDRVLVDAPCSGLGTLRRHPDIKVRMNPETIRRLAEQQRALLRSGVDLCKNGGCIVYSVCTFSRQETDEVVHSVLNDGVVKLEDGPEWLSPWKESQGKYRTYPSEGVLDGFFLTRLRKAS
ncbi:MAG TPA: 16S rRNA (cytosine(967)-C(5))-methyltransferase RsmB [Candidatus Hydrogenedentes bacterium]|nr:16S rRNA (cytosine(967)-C(5))-methyltransferase RsmB [Candidatus Hydrogenedentota bacterium]